MSASNLAARMEGRPRRLTLKMGRTGRRTRPQYNTNAPWPSGFLSVNYSRHTISFCTFIMHKQRRTATPTQYYGVWKFSLFRLFSLFQDNGAWYKKHGRFLIFLNFFLFFHFSIIYFVYLFLRIYIYIIAYIQRYFMFHYHEPIVVK